MGTVVGIDVRDGSVPSAALDDAFAWLHDVDARFSPFRPDSEISRLGRGEVREEECSADVRYVLALCERLARTSDGHFDIRGHRADGRPDPSGLVKGWAVEEAIELLESAGARRCSINAGGDIAVRGGTAPGQPWRIGIRHPDHTDRLAAVVRLQRGAVATSGLYERGDHVVEPRTGAAPRELASLTVVGPSLTWADAYATAGFTMGLDGAGWVASHPGYEAYAITAEGRTAWTPGLTPLLA
jgi:FAD:protein FMN transferase